MLKLNPTPTDPSIPHSYLFQRLSPTLLLAAVLLICALLASTCSLAAQDFSHPDTQPNPQAALTQQANDALAAGDFPAALKLLTTLNAQSPNNPQLLYDLGLTLEALPSSDPTATQPATSGPQQIPTPEFCYRQAIAADPTFAAPHVALGLLLARTGRAAEAHTELTTASTLPGAEPVLQARALRALARLDLNGVPPAPPNPTAASAELLAALKLTPEQPADVLLSAEIAETAADQPSAEQAYRRYLVLEPQDPVATAALAHILLAQRHPADAEALLLPALAHTPGDPSLTAQLAQAYVDSGDAAKTTLAAPLLEKLHAAQPQDAAITRLLAHVYLDTDHPDQADPLYAALLAAQPTHPDPVLLDDRAEALLDLRRPAAAEALLKQAVANPSAFPTPAAFADAALHLAFAASESDDPRTTLQALAQSATVQPPSPSALFLEATANESLHQTRKAVELYKQFLAASAGNLPDQESQARQRLAALANTK